MDIIKSKGRPKEEFNPEKLKASICAAYTAIGEECDDVLLDVVTKNFYFYNNMSTMEIRRQVEEWLMSVNKKAAKAYITVCTSETKPFGCVILQKGVK